jgi:phosphatidylglycerophosphate synthase
MTLNNRWEIGLPLPQQYIGLADRFFYYLSYRIGYYINMAGVSPNMITIFGLACQIGTTCSIIYDTKYFVVTIFLATLSDTMDGFNARRFNKKSINGALIDHGTDWISGIIILSSSIWRWHQYQYFYYFLAVIVYLEKKNIEYSGYVQEYQGSSDIFASTIFQHHGGTS